MYHNRFQWYHKMSQNFFGQFYPYAARIASTAIHDHSDGAGKGRRDRKAPKAASHDATSACKGSRLLEAKLRSKTVSRPPKMTAQLGHFQLLTPRGNPKRVYWRFRSDTGGSGQTIPWSALVGSHWTSRLHTVVTFFDSCHVVLTVPINGKLH